MTKCNLCGATDQDGKFCKECGESLKSAEKVCASCGATDQSGKFCAECGANIGEVSKDVKEVKTGECKFCGAQGQDGRFCEECGEVLKAEKTPKEPGVIENYGKQAAIGAIVVIAVLGMAFLLNQGSTTPGVSAESVDTLADNSGLSAPTAAPSAAPSAAPADSRTLIADIQGMTCGGCVAGVEKTVNKLSGIYSVEVYLREKRGDIVYDPTVIDKKTILDAITKYGYPATEISDTLSGETPTDPTGAVVAPAPAPSAGSESSCGAGGGGCGCGG